MPHRWAQIREIVNRFNQDVARVGPQYTSACAVHDSLFEQTVSQGVGLQDADASLQLFASLVDMLAYENRWSMEQIEQFLDSIAAAIRDTSAKGSADPPLL